MVITAKVKLQSKGESNDGQQLLTFVADYNDGRNKEWAKYTPALSLSMCVLDEVADHFTEGSPYTLTFTPSED
jgi:hypothetical protein